MPKIQIHPTYYPNATVTCSCGATHTIGSTKESMKVDLCRECHPFYTGTQKLIDTAGRVDRFREKMAVAQAHKAKNESKIKPVIQPKAELQSTQAEDRDVDQTVPAETEEAVEVEPEKEDI